MGLSDFYKKKRRRKILGEPSLQKKLTTFVKLASLFKKISGKKWFAEILIPDGDEFEIGCELEIEKAWTIERRD